MIIIKNTERSETMFAGLLSFLGKAFGVAGANMCMIWYIDEPECPKNLIK